MTGLRRRAKYGIIDTDRGDSLVFHLGMSGRWRIDPEQIEKHDHVIIETDEGRKLALNDSRRFGSLDLVATGQLDTLSGLKELGPEPLDISAEDLKHRLAGRTAPIKTLLLDQRVIAGLGNIYVCEALFRAGINPKREGGAISARRVKLLATAIRDVLAEAIAAGGSSLRDFVSPQGELGYFSKNFMVYDREGQACPCGGTVRRFVQAGRSTYYCPRCQR